MKQRLNGLTSGSTVGTTLPERSRDGSRERDPATPYGALLQPPMSLLAGNVRDGCECVPEAILGYN